MARLPEGRISDAAVSDPLPEKPKKATGRPSAYTDAIAAEICERIADGHNLKAICREPGMPDTRTVRRWMLNNESFRLSYARARAEHPHSITDEIEDEARSVTSETAAAVRVRIDALKWIASRLLPQVYGDRAQVDMQTLGADGKPADPAPFVVHFVGAKDGRPE